MKKLILFPGSLALTLPSFAENPSAPQNEKPNIILISADDMGWSDLGCYGSEIQTPTLDRLAEQGLRFTQFHNTAKSFPSRACLLTGVYAQQNGYAKSYTGPLKNCLTVGELLQGAGYRTLWSGKHHGAENPTTRGFDRYWGLLDGATNYFNPGFQRPWEKVKPAQKNMGKKPYRIWGIEKETLSVYTPPEKDFYTTDYFTNHALKWLEEYKDEDKPFFLYLAYNAPHDPLQAWEEDIAKYEGKYLAGYEAIRKARFEKQRAMGLIGPEWALSDPMYDKWEKLSEEEKKTEDRRMAVYAAMIDRLDQNVGRIVGWLEKNGKMDNTLIIFVSDNGASSENNIVAGVGPIGNYTRWDSLKKDWANVSNTPLRYYKSHSFQGGICAPMIVFWKDRIKNPGRISTRLGHFIDVVATIRDITDAPYPEVFRGEKITPLPGESFLPVMQGKKADRKTPLFWEWAKGAAARKGEWKIVRIAPDAPWELYNMKQDPSETVNLASKQPKKLQELVALWENWKKEVSGE